MSADELQVRLRQQIGARSDALRYYTRLGFRFQVRKAGEAGSFFFESSQVPAICQLLERRMPEEVAAVLRQAENICEHRFDLLGYLGLDYGAQIDWHLDAVHGKRAPFKPFHRIHYLDFNEVGDAKVTWELNRHQHLVTLAKAYRFTGDARFATELFQQWKHWHAENPYPMGINWASSLEVAIRSLSWLWVKFLMSDLPGTPPWFLAEWTKALAISGRHVERYLSIYFSANTHLLGEGVALFFIGTLCPELESAAAWTELGWQIVLEEARRQVRADGMHFEQSLYYHVYALDFFLHTRILASRNEQEIPAEFNQTIEKMLDALALLAGSGAPPSFGDDDGGRLFVPQRNRVNHMLDPLATGAVWLRRGDFKRLARDVREETVWLLGPDAVAQFDELESVQPRVESSALEPSGFFVMADSETGAQLVIDAGRQGTATAGHGHADALSVWASKAGEPLLIDPRTCVYVGDGPERDQFRGTAAHNTLRVDNTDQAIPTGPFAWTSLPTVKVDRWITGEIFDLFAGHHDGYGRLTQPVIHHREVFSLKGRFWLVRDIAEGTGKHQLELTWHLAPDLRGQGTLFVSAEGRGMGLLGAEGHGWHQNVSEQFWSPAYGRKEPVPVVSFSTTTELPSQFATLLVPGMEISDEAGVLNRVETHATAVDAYHYRTSREEYYLVFAGDQQSWAVGPCASDAEFLCIGVHQDGRRELIFCNGRRVEVAGKPVVSCAEIVQRCELAEVGGRTEMYASNHAGVTIHDGLKNVSLKQDTVQRPDSLIGSKRAGN
jgi:Heparinase II/III-like protein/Heparinase II/III N-terminus